MKLVTFHQDGGLRLGALREENGKSYVTDLNKADASLPSDIIAFLEGGDATLAKAKQVLASTPATSGIPLNSVKLAAPSA